MIRISALNADSSSSDDSQSASEFKGKTKEAREAEAFALYKEGLGLLQQGEWDKAEVTFNQVLGHAFLAQETRDEDEDDENEDAVLQPEYVLKYTIYKNLATIAAQKGENNKAMEHYLQAVVIDATDVTVWYKIGCLALKLHHYPLARHAFQQGLECNPRHWLCMNQLLPILYALNNYEGCLRYVASAFEMDPGYCKGHAFRAQIYKEQPFLRQSMAGRFKHCDPVCDEIELDDDEAEEYLNEAYEIRANRRKTNQIPEMPVVSLRQPLTTHSWLCLGECLLAVYDYIQDAEKPITMACKVDLTTSAEPPPAAPTEEDKPPEVAQEPTVEASKEEPVAMETNQEEEEEDDDQSQSGMILLSSLTQATEPQETSQGGEEKSSSKKSRKRKRDFWWYDDPGGKRRSSRVRNTGQTKEDEKVNYTELISAMLPASLLTVTEGEETESGQEDVESRSAAEAAKQTELENTTSQEVDASDSQVFYEEEAEHIQQFIEQHRQNSGIIDLLNEYLLGVLTKLSYKWSSNLAEIVLKAYRRFRRHIEYPPYLCRDVPDGRIKNMAKMCLMAGELILDKWLMAKEKMVSPRKSPASALRLLGPKFPGKYYEEDLLYLIGVSNCKDILEEETKSFSIRVWWLRARFLMLKTNMDLATDCFYKTAECLTCERKPEEPETQLTLNHVTMGNTICLDSVNNELEIMKRCQSLEEVQRLHETGDDENVVMLLLNTFSQPKEKIAEIVITERTAQLLLLQEALLRLKDYKRCLIWGEVSVHECLQRHQSATAKDNKDEWINTIIQLMKGLDKCLEKAGTVVGALPSRNLVRLNSSLMQLVEMAMDVPEMATEMAISTMLPWKLLYRLCKHEEPKDAGDKGDKSVKNDESSSDSISHSMPQRFNLLYLAHDYLGRRSWCTSCDGELLLFIIETITEEISRMNASVEHFPCRRDLEHMIEQAFYCLYGHPSRRRPKYLQDHNVSKFQITLTWTRTVHLFNYYKPKTLPEFDSIKSITITQELETLYRQIAKLAPVQDPPVISTDDVTTYIEGIKNDPPVMPSDITHDTSVIDQLYYLLGDYYFKNKEPTKAIKYYIHDLCVNPLRFDSWAGMALARASRLETKLNAHELRLENKPEGTIWKQAVATLRCFKRALDLDRTNTKLWIEYGAIAFQLHSHASRQIRQHEIFGGYGELLDESNTHREDMLKLAGNCYRQASLCDQDINDEQWLHHYMLGKVTEKFKRPIHECLSLYELAAEYLYEDGAKYPKRITYGTNNVPPHLAVESLEVFYRIHAVITKFILSKPREAPYEFLLTMVKKMADSPFALAQEKSLDTSLDESVGVGKGKRSRPRSRELDHSYFRTDSMDQFLRTDMENSMDLLPSVVTNQRTGVPVSISLSDSAESQSPLQGRSLIGSPVAALIPSQPRSNPEIQQSSEASAIPVKNVSSTGSSEQKKKVAENNTTISHDAEPSKTPASAVKERSEGAEEANKEEIKAVSDDAPNTVDKVVDEDKDNSSQGDKKPSSDNMQSSTGAVVSEVKVVSVKDEPEDGPSKSLLPAVDVLRRELQELNDAQPKSDNAADIAVEPKKESIDPPSSDGGKEDVQETDVKDPKVEIIDIKDEPKIDLPESSMPSYDELQRGLQEWNDAQPKVKEEVTTDDNVSSSHVPSSRDDVATTSHMDDDSKIHKSSTSQSQANSGSHMTISGESHADSVAELKMSAESSAYSEIEQAVASIPDTDNTQVKDMNEVNGERLATPDSCGGQDGPSSADIAETTQALKELSAAISGADVSDSCLDVSGEEPPPVTSSPDDSSQDSTTAQLEKLKSELLALNQVACQDPLPPVPDFPAWKSEESERESDDDVCSSTKRDVPRSTASAGGSSEYTIQGGQVVSSSETFHEPSIKPAASKSNLDGVCSPQPDSSVTAADINKASTEVKEAQEQPEHSSFSDSDCIVIDSDTDPVHLPCDSPPVVTVKRDAVDADVDGPDGAVDAAEVKASPAGTSADQDALKKGVTEDATPCASTSKKDEHMDTDANDKDTDDVMATNDVTLATITPATSATATITLATGGTTEASKEDPAAEGDAKTSLSSQKDCGASPGHESMETEEVKEEEIVTLVKQDEDKNEVNPVADKVVDKMASVSEEKSSEAKKTSVQVTETSKKSPSSGPPMVAASDDKNKELLAYCIRAYLLCLARFPQHFKCLYRLSHIYYTSKYYRNVRYAHDYLLGNVNWQHLPYMTAPGLFQERKSTNFFQNLWKNPIAEIDRAGSFAAHLVRSLLLLIDVLREEKNPQLLFTIAQQLFRTPDMGKKYLLDTIRLELANRGFEVSLKLIENMVDEKAKEANESVRSAFVILMYKVWQQGIKMERKTGIGERVNKLFPQIYGKCFEKKLEKGSSVLEQAIRYCQQIMLAPQVSHTPSTSESFGSGGPLASSSPARVSQTSQAGPGEKKPSPSPAAEARQIAMKGMKLLPPGTTKYSPSSSSSGIKRPLTDVLASQAKVQKTSEKSRSTGGIPKLPNLSNLMQSQAQLMQAQSLASSFTAAENAQYAQILSKCYGFPSSDAQALWNSLIYQSITHQNPAALAKVMMMAQQGNLGQSPGRLPMSSPGKSHANPMSTSSKPGQKFDPVAMQKLKETFRSGLQHIQKKKPNLSLVMPSSSGKKTMTSSGSVGHNQSKMASSHRPGVFSKHGNIHHTTGTSKSTLPKTGGSPGRPKMDNNSKVQSIMDKILATGGVSKSLQQALKTVSEKQKDLEVQKFKAQPSSSSGSPSRVAHVSGSSSQHLKAKMKTVSEKQKDFDVQKMLVKSHFPQGPSKMASAQRPQAVATTTTAPKPRTIYLPGASATSLSCDLSVPESLGIKPTFSMPKPSLPPKPKPTSPQIPIITVAQPIPQSPLRMASSRGTPSRLHSSSSSDCIIISGTDTDDDDDDDDDDDNVVVGVSRKRRSSKYENDSDYVATDDEGKDSD